MYSNYNGLAGMIVLMGGNKKGQQMPPFSKTKLYLLKLLSYTCHKVFTVHTGNII